ncbi:MAG: hypothetical protein ACT4UP_10355 [Gammaproteobacteria bacterium]
MSATKDIHPIVAILWFVAAGLAFAATAIRYLKDHDIKAGVAVGGAFCLVMGIVFWQRRRKPRSPV